MIPGKSRLMLMFSVLLVLLVVVDLLQVLPIRKILSDLDGLGIFFSSSSASSVSHRGGAHGHLMKPGVDRRLMNTELRSTNKKDLNTLQPRILGLSSYEKAKKKGKALVCAMADPSSIGTAATSRWTKYEHLQSWGWSAKKAGKARTDWIVADYGHVTKNCPGLLELVGDLKNGKAFDWQHDEDTEKDGILYPATNAQFSNVYWPEQGVIMANDNYSPVYQVEQGKASRTPWKDAQGKPYPIVPLKQWSDINALSYTSLLTPSPPPLRYILRRNISNELTRKLIEQITQKHNLGPTNKAAPLWPGLILEPGLEGFEALIASPNLAGVCWMLIQHAESTLGGGRKTIRSLRVWRDRGTVYAPSILVEVGNIS